MKDICKNCDYYTVLKTENDTIIGTSCNLPLSIFLERSEAGLYDKDTENTCYDFKEKEHIDENE